MRKSYAEGRDKGASDNYIRVCEDWRRLYLKADRQELIRRFQLKSDEEAVYLDFFSETYRIDNETGMITLLSDPERILGFNTIMCIYHLFHYSKKDACIKGEFVPYRQVKRGAPFAPAFEKTVVKNLAKAFTGRTEAFIRAGDALGGVRTKQGDAGFVLESYPGIPVMLIFWDGDDEFEAQANILFDADITDFLHEETVVCLGSEAVRRMTEAAKIGKAENLLGSTY